MDVKVGEAWVRVIRGDICDCLTDAIVNAANNNLWMGAGVAGAIKRRGGEEIEREAMQKGPIPVGEAVPTRAGRLKAKYIIHAAAMGQDLVTDAAKVGMATRTSLNRAEELGLVSIAFPALGAGVGGFPKEDAAKVMIREVIEFLKAGSKLQEVVFVLFDDETQQVFEQTFVHTLELNVP